MSLLAVVATPANAAYLGDTVCSGLGYAGASTGGNQRDNFFGLVLEFEGVDNGTVDDSDKDAYQPVAEADATYLSTEALTGATEIDYCFTGNTDIVLLVGGNPVFHISCSQHLMDGTVVGYGAVTDFWLDQRLGNPNGKDYCTNGLPDIPQGAVASLAVGECVFDQASAYPVTYSLTVNDGDEPFSLWADGVEVDADLGEGTDVSAGDFAPDTELEIRDGNGVVVASATVPEADCDPVAAVASLAVGECVFDQASAYPVTYSLTINDGAGPFSLFVDGVEDDSVTLTGGDDQSLGDFAPGTELEIRDGDTVLASISVPDGTCQPDPDPDPVPAITLVKSPVVGDGSDLVDVGAPNPLLQFSDSDGAAQTALYSYVIENTGDEALINLSLVDDRIAAADLDLSDCPEVLAVGASCTATGSEDFSLAQAEDVVAGDGTVTNTGTVTAIGQESEGDVTAADDATIVFGIVFSEVQEKEDPKPAPEVKSAAEEQPAPAVESAAEELPATGLDAEGLLPLSLLLIAIGAAILWLDRPWVGVVR